MAEYNRGPTAVLKNALDYGYKEWNRKPIAFVGYGGVGGARAVEQLRLHAIELQMAPIRTAVHIQIPVYLGVLKEGRSLNDFEPVVQSGKDMLDQLVWWANALWPRGRRSPRRRSGSQRGCLTSPLREVETGKQRAAGSGGGRLKLSNPLPKFASLRSSNFDLPQGGRYSSAAAVAAAAHDVAPPGLPGNDVACRRSASGRLDVLVRAEEVVRDRISA